MTSVAEPQEAVVRGVRVRHPLVWFACLAGAIVALFLLSIAEGSVTIPLREIVRILLGRGASRASWYTIVIQLRLPRTLTAALAGMALGGSGVQMQTLFRNPLADPYILGISSGASLGVGLLILAGGPSGFAIARQAGLLANLGVAGAAAAGALAMLAVILTFASRLKSPVVLLVVGVMIGYFTSALTSLLVYFADPSDVQRFQAWGFGSFRNVGWSGLPVLGLAVAIGSGVALVLIKQLNVMMLGENYARSLGVNVRVARFGILASSSMLAGAVTAYCGPIAFLGIAAPHLARSIFGTSDHRVIVPGAMLLGAALALGCGLAAELPGTNLQLPVNVASSAIGAPVVIAVIVRMAKSRRVF